jgi:hypothetical protein
LFCLRFNACVDDCCFHGSIVSHSQHRCKMFFQAQWEWPSFLWMTPNLHFSSLTSQLPSLWSSTRPKSRGGPLHSPPRTKDCCLLAHKHHRPLPKTVLSRLNAFTVSMTCYHCTSLPLLPMHQVSCYQKTCKAGSQARS